MDGGQYGTAFKFRKREGAISVSFCVSDNYCQHLAVVVASILEHAAEEDRFVFHVLTKMISDGNVRRLKQMEVEAKQRCRFVFHHVDRSRFDKFPLPLEHITQEMYYRYLLPEILEDEERTIYMDVDVLVYGSLRRFWEIELGDCLLAGTTDIKEDSPGFRAYKRQLGMQPDAPYFYSGMLVMDLARLRAAKFCDRCMANTGKSYRFLDWPDQDIINLTMEGQILSLPQAWHCTDPKVLQPGENILIRHFANFSAKPWCCLYKNRTWPEYLKYLRRTPYRDRAWAFVGSHIRGFFFFRYTKKGVERILVCGILVWRRKRVRA